jgi:hypothetical protein
MVTGSEMSAGTGGNDLAVNDVDIPPKFFVRSIVAGIAQGDAEIKGIFLVQGVYRLNGGVEDMGCIHHDRRVDGSVCPGEFWIQLLKVNQLVRRFLVGDMDIVMVKKCSSFAFGGSAGTT